MTSVETGGVNWFLSPLSLLKVFGYLRNACRATTDMQHCFKAARPHSIILSTYNPIHTTMGCGKQGFPSAQPYLSHIFCTANTQYALST
ncbi:hypothetical protein ACN38_g7641 [Penicillium nordicum]|uniref:Uncharacterized protein n=1 Tax=Penicillium nordicum TaxID=229535 RepID=A0A0M8NXU6_9EURO|nr:hypothetical protein ACN38_g7641 [Penicillium nordicum]